MTTVPEESTTGRWAGSLGLALLLHAVVVALLSILQPLRVDPAPASAAPIQLVFARPVESSDPSDQPTHFSELPVDRADLPPDRADALSNVDSRARDEVDGGPTTALPRLEGESDAPAVELTRQSESEESRPQQAGDDGEDFESKDGLAELQPLESRRTAEEAETGAEAGDRAGDPDPDQRMAGDSRGDLLQGQPQPRGETSLLDVRRTGDSEISQEATANPGGNAPLFGDLTLNTMAWEWAPWMQRFSRDFHRNWRPPFAYMMGIIHGKHRVRVEVAKDGRLLDVELLEEDGHQSLAQASLANLNGIAPLAPLPDNFPEDTLILQLSITYQERKAPR